MTQKPKGTYWRCKKCKTIEFIPFGEFGIREPVAVYCMRCGGKNKKRKMEKIDNAIS
jgi:hypothetical protein